MDAIQSLIQALQANPEDWVIRLLVAEKLHEQGAVDDAARIVGEAPTAPNNTDELQKAATYGGINAFPQVEAYVSANPTDGYGHQILGYLYQSQGNEAQAAKHNQAAQALGAASVLPIAPPQILAPPVSGPQTQPHSQVQAPPIVGHQTQPLPEVQAPPINAGPQSQALPEVQAPGITAPAINAGPPTGLGQTQEMTGPYDPNAYAPPLDVAVNQIPVSQAAVNSEYGESKKSGKVMAAVFAAIGVHVILAIIALLVVVSQKTRKEPEIVASVVGPPTAKQEMQKKNVVKQVKKSTSAAAAAAPVARLMRANAVAKFSLPKVTKTSTGPLGMGQGNLGSGGFGGTGSGLGSGASFFGSSSSGQRFLFILDHSRSMKKHQVELRDKELERVLKSLNGVQYQVLLFAGPAYYGNPGWKVTSKNNSSADVVDPSGKVYKIGSIPKADWLESTSVNRRKVLKHLEETPLFLGTNWDTAFKIGLEMNPPPDVIFFMADGTGQSSPGKIQSMANRKGSPVINTIAMQTAQGSDKFAAVAKNSKGSYTIVDSKGKPIDGFDFIKSPAKYKRRLETK